MSHTWELGDCYWHPVLSRMRLNVLQCQDSPSPCRLFQPSMSMVLSLRAQPPVLSPQKRPCSHCREGGTGWTFPRTEHRTQSMQTCLVPALLGHLCGLEKVPELLSKPQVNASECLAVQGPRVLLSGSFPRPGMLQGQIIIRCRLRWPTLVAVAAARKWGMKRMESRRVWATVGQDGLLAVCHWARSYPLWGAASCQWGLMGYYSRSSHPYT